MSRVIYRNMLFKKILAFALIFLILLTTQMTCIAGSHDTALQTIQNDISARSQEIIDYQYNNPNFTSALGNTSYALAALWKNQDTTAANAKIEYVNTNWPCTQDPAVEPAAYWSMGQLIRIWYLFNANSSFYPGRITSNADAAIKDQFWNFVYKRSKVSDADYSDVWTIHWSENHDIMQKSIYLLALQMLLSDSSYANQTLYDGNNLYKHYNAWSNYFVEYFRERAKKGLLVEQGSPTYGKYTIQSVINIRDFTRSERLADTAEEFLNLWFADYAQECLNGVRGGAKTRTYKDRYSWNGESASEYVYSYIYFNMPSFLISSHPSYLISATSDYVVPLEIMDLALYPDSKGSYEYISTRPARGQILTDGYIMEFPAYIRRYSYITPGYTMGAFTIDRTKTYSTINAQNRWMGITFSGKENSRVFASCKGTAQSGQTAYNEMTGVADGKAMIVQKLQEATYASDMRVFFSLDLVREEQSGWVFAYDPDGTGYAAVKPASGTYSWVNETVTINPIQDVYITNGTSSDTNYSNSTDLRVKNSSINGSISYLQFDVGSSTADVVNNSTLKIYVNNKTAGNVIIKLYGIHDDSWDGSTMTWNTGSPNHSSTGYSVTGEGTTAILLDTKTITASGQYYEFDVNNFINSQLESNDRIVSFMAVAENTDGNSATMNTAECASNKPEYNSTVGKWMTLTEQYAPIVFQTALCGDYANGFTDFKTDVLNNTFRWNSSTEFEYEGTGGGNLKYYTSTALPKINNVTVNLNESKTYDSPYISSTYDSTEITVTNTDSEDLILDFDPEAVEYTAVADSFIRNDTPDTNYGSSTAVTVKNNAALGGRIGYVRFDASALSNSAVYKAALKLYATGGTADTVNNIYLISDDSWNESTMTWNSGSPNHASTGYTVTGVGTTAILVASLTVKANESKYYEIDISSYVNDHMASNKIFSFLIAGNSQDGIIVNYNSKEASSNKPILELTPATKTVINSEADSFVRNDTADTNYGNETSVYVKNNTALGGRIGYFRFDATGISSNFVSKAVLKLYATGGTSNTVNKIYLIDSDSWDESTMTWNTGSPNHASTGYTVTGAGTTAILVASPTITASQTVCYEFDITEYVNGHLSKDKNFSFLIAGNAQDGVIVNYSSKEAGTNNPALEVIY